jgi:hypothetical protein
VPSREADRCPYHGHRATVVNVLAALTIERTHRAHGNGEIVLDQVRFQRPDDGVGVDYVIHLLSLSGSGSHPQGDDANRAEHKRFTVDGV